VTKALFTVIASEAKQSIRHVKEEWIARRVAPRNDERGFDAALRRRLVAEIRLYRAVNLDGQRITVAVLGIAGGDAESSPR